MESTLSSSVLSYLIISGGTGANSFASAFGLAPAFALPVSDDGGSSAEILRCFGGPSIGDIRSRLIRLIPLSEGISENREDKERQAIYNLMAYRFPVDVSEMIVRDLWGEIVEGRGSLWNDIGEDKKECIRAFLVHFQALCLRRAHKRFSFQNFSLGNGFLTGARDLFSSLPSAIFLFKAIAGVNEGAQVIPVINTNQTMTIAAQLADFTTIVGQCNISHPAPNLVHTVASSSRAVPSLREIGVSHIRYGMRRDSQTFDTAQSHISNERHHSLPSSAHSNRESDLSWSGNNLAYVKGMEEAPLNARINHLFYINLYGQEIFPEPNQDFLAAIERRDILVYSCGSLWTSIVPCLALRGLASAIAESTSLRAKVLLLNSINDRETLNYKATDYIETIANVLCHYDPPHSNHLDRPVAWTKRSFITHVVFLQGGQIDVNEDEIQELGIKVVCVPRSVHNVPNGETPLFDNRNLKWAMERVAEEL